MKLEEYKKQLTVPIQDATLCYLIRDNEILFAIKKRGFGVGILNGPGGKKNPDETIEEALIREIQEEIGVLLKSYQPVGILDFYFPQNPTDINKNQRVYVYLADSWDGQPQESEEMKPSWFKRGQIPIDKMWAADKLWLPQVLAGQKVVAEFAYDQNDKLIEHNLQIVNNLP